MSAFIYGIDYIIAYILFIYTFLIVVDALLSWVPSLKTGIVGRLLGKVVDPYISIIERFVPPFGGISFAPVVAIFILYLARDFVLPNFFSLLIRIFS